MADDQSPPPSRAAGLLTIDLGPDLKRNWTQWCAERGLVPGKTLRGLVEKALVDGSAVATTELGEPVRVVVAAGPDRGTKVGREIQFTPSENAAIEAMAAAQGFAFQEWVIAAVRSALAQAPSYGQAELEALTQSNAQMAQVVIDLAAALRRQEGDAGAAEPIARLEGAIRQHVETVSSAMAQGAQRWQLKISG